MFDVSFHFWLFWTDSHIAINFSFSEAIKFWVIYCLNNTTNNQCSKSRFKFSTSQANKQFLLQLQKLKRGKKSISEPWNDITTWIKNKEPNKFHFARTTIVLIRKVFKIIQMCSRWRTEEKNLFWMYTYIYKYKFFICPKDKPTNKQANQ